MYFFKKSGRQYLDLTGNLILSHNDQLVKSRSTSARPTKILNAKFIINAGNLRIRDKLKATIITLRFIWGKPDPLTIDKTNFKAPFNACGGL